MVDDNKELVDLISEAIKQNLEKYMLSSLSNKEIRDKCAQAALSIILPELDKYRSALTATNEYLETLSGFAQLAVQDLQKGIEANETALKTTTGHTEGGG
jgi:uncharacterized protein YaaN involved in tellurite resistance